MRQKIWNRLIASARLLVVLLSLVPSIHSEPTTPVGINLAGPSDWNEEHPFVDVFRLSRQWISQREGASWGKGPKLDQDEHGWVRRLEPGCYAETPVVTHGHHPPGIYTVLYDGQGPPCNGQPRPVIRSKSPEIRPPHTPPQPNH